MGMISLCVARFEPTQSHLNCMLWPFQVSANRLRRRKILTLFFDSHCKRTRRRILLRWNTSEEIQTAQNAMAIFSCVIEISTVLIRAMAVKFISQLTSIGWEWSIYTFVFIPKPSTHSARLKTKTRHTKKCNLFICVSFAVVLLQ